MIFFPNALLSNSIFLTIKKVQIMKKTTIFAVALMLTVFGFSQNRVNVKKELRNMSCLSAASIYETSNHSSDNFTRKENNIKDEDDIGITYYDMQSNASMPNRIYKYPDGTIGATFIYGMDYPNFPDRRTGYNYFDGSSWATAQTIESDRTGFPSYVPWNENGEIVVAHYSGAATDGLIISSRTEKGTGTWTETDFFGPATSGGYSWPRAATGGVNHSDLHIIALTSPEIVYQGMEGALLYSRSPDGGQTWDFQDVLIDDINANYYTGFRPDSYEIATHGDNVAFVVGDAWSDLVLMKSTDNGNTWTKTIVWEHPYPFWNNTPTDTFYCVDGAHSLAFDNSGKIHIAFGINRAYSDSTGTYWFPAVDGIGYWNEDRPTFSNNLNALCPYSDCSYSELVDDYSLIGWTQDVDDDGEIDILWDDIARYYLGLSSMPQLVIDEQNHIFLVYSSVTETYESVTQNYRHLWVRNSVDGGEYWGNFYDLNSDLAYVFSECVFPSLSPTSDDFLYLVFQEDDQPGMAVKGDLDPYGENHIVYMSIQKGDVPEYGTLSGTVTDVWNGLPLEGATITLSGSSYSCSTGEDGYYMFLNIPVGTYTAYCTKPDYLPDTAIVAISCCGTTHDFQLESTILQPPQNLLAEINCYDVTLLWEMPAIPGLQGFNIYRDATLIGFTNEQTYSETLTPGAVHEFCVSSVYDTGESECSDNVTVIIDNYQSPENFNAVLVEADVLCTWDSIDNKGFLGYRVYRNIEDISGLITSSYYLDVNPDSGIYNYFVKAEYDYCLSDPSDSVTIVLAGIDEKYINTLNIYPNPAKEYVIIKSENKIEKISIISNNGKKEDEIIVNKKYYKLNTSKLNAGLYLINIKINNETISSRLIIE